MKKFISNIFLWLIVLPAYSQWQGVNGPFFQTAVQMISGYQGSDLLLFAGYGNQVDTIDNEGQNGVMYSRMLNSVISDIALFNNGVSGVCVYQTDTIIYGTFWTANGNSFLRSVKVNFNTLEQFASFNSRVNNMKVLNEELYAVGVFTEAEGIQTNGIVKFDGTNWQTVGPLINTVFCNINDVEIYQGELYIAGNILTEDGLHDLLVLRDNEWQIVGEGINGSMAHINRLCIYDNELIIGGMIRQSDGHVGHCIQKWNGEIWSEVGNSLQGTNMSTSTFSQVWDMKVEGDYLYVSGDFQYANYTPIKCLARWDGTQWCGFYTEEVQMPLFRFTFSNGQLILPYNQPLGNENSMLYVYTLGDEVFPCSPPVTSSNDFAETASPFALHPNPSTHTVFLTSPDLTPGSFVRIYNLSGQLLYEQNVLEQNEHLAIATAQIGPPGMYLVQLHHPGKAMAVQKLVVAE
jgi:hypothetical protein